MASAALVDLDELVLMCRDERSRSYIIEATNCYRGGAYRACVVTTWIALCFDLIDKLRELSLAGDKRAEALVEDIDKARSSNDVAKSLRLERELLDIARDQFELISHIEHIDLSRLQEDRNRCAHPSLQSDDQAFSPPAELARTHLRAAVVHVLQHPPVQGKAALDRLLKEVGSEYFPTEVDKAKASLASGPLKRPREVLVRNFTVVLLKNFVLSTTEWKARHRMLAALSAVRALHPAMFEASLREKIALIIRNVLDKDLGLVTRLIWKIEEIWRFCPPDLQHRLENYVENLPVDDLDDMDVLLEIEPLLVAAERRLSVTTAKEFFAAILFKLPTRIGDRFIAIYEESESYAEANEWAKHMRLYSSDFSQQQQEKILKVIAVNSQIRNSFEAEVLVKSLRQSKKFSASEFDSLLEKNDLSAFKT